MDEVTRVKSMTNVSSVIVPVRVAEDLTVQVPPNGTLKNTDVYGLSKIKQFFKVTTEDCNVQRRVNLNEGR